MYSNNNYTRILLKCTSTFSNNTSTKLIESLPEILSHTAQFNASHKGNYNYCGMHVNLYTVLTSTKLIKIINSEDMPSSYNLKY